MKYLFLIVLILLLPVSTPAQQETVGQKVTPKKIKQVLTDYLDKQSAALPHLELRYSEIDLPEAFHVPSGRVDFQVIPARPGIIGSRRMTLLIRVDGQIVENQSVRVELEALGKILIATDNLRRGTILTPDKVEYRRQDVSRLKEPLYEIDDIYGKRLTRTIRLGQPLQRSQVEFPPAIKRGDRVTIQAQRGSLLLTAAGEAKDDGLPGETIRVTNLGSNKVVLCRVAEPGLVIVEF